MALDIHGCCSLALKSVNAFHWLLSFSSSHWLLPSPHWYLIGSQHMRMRLVFTLGGALALNSSRGLPLALTNSGGGLSLALLAPGSNKNVLN